VESNNNNSPPRPIYRLRLLLLVAALASLGYFAFDYYRDSEEAIPPQADDTLVSAADVPSPVTTPSANAVTGTTIDYVIKRNDTLEQVFRRLNLSLNDLSAIREIPEARAALDMFKPGDVISLNYVDGSVQLLKRRLNNSDLLVVTRADGNFKSEVAHEIVEARVRTVRGVVDSSLYASAHDAGLSADLIMRMANDIFGWDIDFALDIRHGDEFTLEYQQLFRDNQYIGDGKILAAEFINDHHAFRAVRFDSADGSISNYFTPEGKSMRKQFLRAPVDFTHISSRFSLARMHPILNLIRAHKGVDYAAPIGTPVKASGDGKVEFAGTRGGFGNVIVLDHGAGITTVYGHLSRFASVHVGTRVTQGQTIGFVGRSGLATGPHLHYEYRVNGVYKDPRSVALPDASPIPSAYLVEFQQQSHQALEALNNMAPKVVQTADSDVPSLRN
jgi:murein DD-endopeptidase MepM/ murein hydrolase activator NlpD